MSINDDSNNNYLEVLEDLLDAQNTIKKVQDIVLRTIVSADPEYRSYEDAFDEIYHILLSASESRRTERSG
jgi:hypothetical protein